MPVLRSVDVFVKARADIRTQSASGGLVTLLATFTAFLLFCGQIYVYIFPTQSHTLHLSESTQFPMMAQDVVDPFQKRLYDIKGKIPLYFKVTFLHLSCDNLVVKLNSEMIHGDDYSGWSGSSSSSGNKKKKRSRKNTTIKRYVPRSAEVRQIFGSEHSAHAKAQSGRGCTLIGNMRVPIVAGNLGITMSKEKWMEAINYFMTHSNQSPDEKDLKSSGTSNDFNTTNFVHEVRFGKKGSAASKGLTSSGYTPPLEGTLHHIENDLGGIALQEIMVKLIPTVHSNPGLFSQLFGSGNRPFYQMSVVDHTLKPETMVASGGGAAMPGISLAYDVMPLAVHIDEAGGSDGGFLGFLSSMIGIVGGCFVTVGLFAGCAVKSVEAMAKKID